MEVRLWMKFTIRSTSSIFMCDKLRRNIEVPARSSQWMTLSLSDAGPSVHRSSTSLPFMAATLVSVMCFAIRPALACSHDASSANRFTSGCAATQRWRALSQYARASAPVSNVKPDGGSGSADGIGSSGSHEQHVVAAFNQPLPGALQPARATHVWRGQREYRAGDPEPG